MSETDREVLRDIVGILIFPGSIVAYASSRGFFITVVKEIVYNKLGKPVRLSLLYPKIKYAIYERTETEVIGTKSLYVGAQELIAIDKDRFKHYRGLSSFHRVPDAVDKVLGLSNNVRWHNGVAVPWVWGRNSNDTLGFYFAGELGIDLYGPFSTLREALKEQEEYLKKI